MKNIAIVLILGVMANLAHSQTSANAQQEANSAATSFGSMTFSQSPEHTTSTVRNVSAPILGAYAASFSPLNCGQTAQGGLAVAGVTIAGGASKDSESCVLEVAAAETARQSTITPDQSESNALRQAAINMRCSINETVYKALIAAGVKCATKPESMVSRTDDQPQSTRVAGN